ncbi:MAG: preprotein translocase subunit SecE [Flavobacteriia bacterium]|nr:MAG: preprotein translocase subunit SecE [Flavobacteriia bacterium]
MNNLAQYVKASFKELREHMTWITWEEAQKSTVVVAVFTVIFALLIFLADKAFQNVLSGLFKIF